MYELFLGSRLRRRGGRGRVGGRRVVYGQRCHVVGLVPNLLVPDQIEGMQCDHVDEPSVGLLCHRAARIGRVGDRGGPERCVRLGRRRRRHVLLHTIRCGVAAHQQLPALPVQQRLLVDVDMLRGDGMLVAGVRAEFLAAAVVVVLLLSLLFIVVQLLFLDEQTVQTVDLIA